MPSCFEGGYGGRMVISWGAVKASFSISKAIKIMKEAELKWKEDFMNAPRLV